MYSNALSVVSVGLNFKSNHFNHLQDVRNPPAINILHLEIYELDAYLNNSKEISLTEFKKRFWHIKDLSIESRGTCVTLDFDNLVKSLDQNLRRFDFLNEKNSVAQKKSGWRKLLEIISREVNWGIKDQVKCLFQQVEERPPRMYNEKKLVKILKQLSSQLYYYLRQTSSITEVQGLHVMDGEKTKYLFFAVNPLSSSDIFQTIKRDWEGQNLIEIVNKVYDQSEGIDNEVERKKMKRRGERSKDYAENLNNLFYNNSGNINLIDFIQSHRSSHQIFNIQDHRLPEEGIYFVKPCDVFPKKGYKRHGEEQLCDIVELIEELNTRGKLKYQIYGRKRPCMSCFGRLCHVKNKQKSNLAFSKYPGFLWIKAFMEQPYDVQMSTFRLFISKASCVSLDKMGQYCLSEGTESNKGSDTLHHGKSPSLVLTNPDCSIDKRRLMNWVLTTH